jgi:competence ComEA-like helix-hairpin-helix protein
MATISLRAYIREIESLIDRNQTDTAIAHCMHILRTMPKHINTYRMLGKALHEAQRFADAADVFQRVISVVPDDFVSNVGLSIIRQDEGNMDSAIWHMERAYETQPSNQPIQEELRRLYGKRDGLQPPRVRLTRGALARMYMKGHLYTQAIGELRAALAEDPHRADLQVLLAQAYFLTGQKVDAVEVCSQLIKKSPYCLEANRLLALILPNTERAKDAEIYRQRVIALDPYLQKSNPATLLSDSVSDAAVNIEKLDILPDQVSGDKVQPAWATTLGEPFEISEEQELPEWFREDQQPGSAKQSQAQLSQQSRPSKVTWDTSTGEMGTDWLKEYEQATAPQETAEITSEPEIPDWMKAAGWEPSKGGDEEAPLSWEEFESENDDQIEQGTIPDWLKAIAPGSQDEGASNWLQERTPGASDTIVNWLNETQGQTTEDDLNDLENALDQAIAQKESGQVEEIEEVPDWLRGLEKQGPSNGPATGELHIPEWMKEDELTESETGTQADAGQEWLKEIGSELPLEPPVGQTAEPAAQVTSFEIPDWLKPLEPEVGQELGEDILSMQTVISPPVVNELLPESPQELPEGEEKELQANVEVEIPEWLKSMVSETEAGPGSEAVGEETIIAQVPEAETILLEGTDNEDLVTQVQPVIEESISPAQVNEEELQLPDISAADSGLMNEDDALAFLSSLAAKHEGEAGWLEAVVEETMGEDASAMAPAQLELPAQPQLEDTIVTAPDEIGAEAHPDEEEIPDWLKPMFAEAQTDQLPEASSEDTLIVASPAKQEAAPVDSSEGEGFFEPALEDHEDTILFSAAVEDETKVETFGEAEPVELGLAAAETGLMDEDEALTFLASLAAKHEGEDDWLKSVVEETMGEDASVLEKKPDELQPESLDQTLVISQKNESLAQDLEKGLVDNEEIPEWLKALSEDDEDTPTLQFLSKIEAANKVDPNTASLSDLEDIPGVGFIMAQNILIYRQAHGHIKQLEDLANVPGITAADINGLKDFMEIPEVKAEPGRVTAPLDARETPVSQALNEARIYIKEQNFVEAADSYSSLIENGQFLPEIINDLQVVLDQYPKNVNLWQALGDACLRNEQLQEAFEAYSRAEELLK